MSKKENVSKTKNTIKLTRRELRRVFRKHAVHRSNSHYPNDRTAWLSRVEEELFGTTTLKRWRE